MLLIRLGLAIQKLLILSFFIFSIIFTSNVFAVVYVITDIGPQPLLGSRVVINDSSQIAVGQSVWDNGVVTQIGTLGGAFTTAKGINSLGEVVGTSATGIGQVRHAFKWSAGNMLDIDVIDNGSNPNYVSSANAINTNGQVAYEVTTQGITSSYILEDSIATSIITPFDLTLDLVVASDINESGEVAGYSRTTFLDINEIKQNNYGWIYSANTLTQLHDIDDSTSDSRIRALALNNNSEVVGDSYQSTFGYVEAATLWLDTIAVNLHPNNPADNSVAVDINDSGNVVGVQHTAGTEFGGPILYYNPTTSVLDTLTLSDTVNPDSWSALESATGINNLDQIVGFGRQAGSNQSHAYLLTPVDEQVEASLSVTASASVETALIDEAVNYTVEVTNNGSTPATWVNTSMIVYPYIFGPSNGMTFNSATPGQGICTGENPINCYIGELQPGETVLIDLSLTYHIADAALLSIENLVSAQLETDESDNVAAVSLNVIPAPLVDLSVTVIDSTDPVTMGQQFYYDITVMNAGPDTANNITLNSPVPDMTELVSLSTTSGSCTVSTSISCELGTMPVGASSVITMIVNPLDIGDIILTGVIISSDESDTDNSNNTATEVTTVVPVNDVDLDGFDYPLDCNDDDPTINPGAIEIPYDGIDQDCNGTDLTDVDLDGFDFPLDCNDDNPVINPSVIEIKHDGIDQDCNGYDLTIEITEAVAKAKNGLLKVSATSRLGPDAALVVDGFGAMTFNTRKSIWTLTLRKLTSVPSSVTVIGTEGADTAQTRTR